MPLEIDPTDVESESADSNATINPGNRIAPTQFRILDLFTIITLAAFAFAILVPVIQRIRSEHLWIGLGALTIQLASAIATFAALAVRRKTMLRQTGQQIGVAFSGELPWKYWPVVKCGLIIAGAGLLQFVISLSLLFMFQSREEFAPVIGIVFLIYSLQLGYFFGSSISQLHWRSYPGVIEFYENGISLDGRTLTPWDRVAVRDSKLYNDRIVLVSDATNISRGRTTQTARVTDSLRKQLQIQAAKTAS